LKLIYLYISLGILVVSSLPAQSKFNTFITSSDTLNKPRRNALVITEAAIAAITLVGLDQLWYADFERSNFKTTNDNSEWLQLDKFGHVFSSYQLGRLGANALNWAGVSKKNQLIYGSTLGLGFLTAVEVLDGFSAEWGFSWGDMLANASGTALYVGQELLWDEQRIALKYSFSRTGLARQNPSKLGNGLSEEFLKDYNGQTYWLSFNINSFLKTSFLPDWLNLAAGYGGHGLLSGRTGNEAFPNQNPYRQYYLSFDIDLTRIKTKSRFLKSIFDVFNTIKVPMPTLEYNGENGLRLHYIYF
jgi:hypothetical protein